MVASTRDLRVLRRRTTRVRRFLLQLIYMLHDPLKAHIRIDQEHAKALSRIGVETVYDLLRYIPVRYTSVSTLTLIKDATPQDRVTLYGTITNLTTKKSFRGGMPMAEGVLTDTTESIKVVWFNQAYIAKMVREGQYIALTGKITVSKSGVKTLSNPEIDKSTHLPIDAHRSLFSEGKDIEQDFIMPVYKETKGITSKWLYYAVQKCLSKNVLDEVQEYFSEELLARYNLPTLTTALVWAHTPKREKDAIVAKKRFAFEEVFFIQLDKAREQKAYRDMTSYPVAIEKGDIQTFIDRFSFVPTNGQMTVLDHILDDFAKPYPMSRLLEGDVGSGKTFVAAAASYAVIRNRPAQQTFGTLQVAYMAPTEILAGQHFESFISFFAGTGIQIALITGSGCKKFPSKVSPHEATDISRSQLTKWVANGEIAIVIGTHALISKNVVFKHLALAIVDEQHRFGTKQRSALAKKDTHSPHFLSMTATPIPRTLALTVFGDLDLSVLDQMPSGRKPIKTTLVRPDGISSMYDLVRRELALGRQAYVICPRIQEPDEATEQRLSMKSVTQEASRLKATIFADARIGILHSKMTKAKKDEIMDAFLSHTIDILVATSVVEVGVNVPNATTIIIEGAERFGLSQLHQLRGRVMRGSHQPYCFLCVGTESDKSIDRLQALIDAKNGFELAELDLALRGAGDLAGAKQWGVSDIGMEAIKNIKMVEAARIEARALIARGDISDSLARQEKLRGTKVHFE
jgi:ATP-dependent DNA helicase RecG